MNSPRDIGLSFDKWRLNQRETVERIMGSDKKFVFLNAPTGCGKTIIGMACCKLFMEKGGKSYYCVSTKQLQDQILRDFPFVNVVKGRNNYSCNIAPVSCDMGICRVNGSCDDKDVCAYEVAKRKAMASEQTIMNYSYFCLVMNYGEVWDNRSFIVFDEAHNIEDVLSGFSSISFSKKYLSEKGVGLTDLTDFIPKISDIVNKEVKQIQSILGEYDTPEDVPQDLIRAYNEGNSTLRKLKTITDIDADWVIDEKEYCYNISPVLTAPFSSFLFHFQEKVLFMSATLVKDRLLSVLGLTSDMVEYIEMPNLFNKKTREIFFNPIADMSYINEANNINTMSNALDRILDLHKNEKGLVHSVAGRTMHSLYSNSQRKNRFFLAYGKDRERIFQEFKESRNGVIISPSFEEGIDLPYDECRFMVFPKVPFPNLSEAVTKKRCENDKRYMHFLAVDRFLQGIGRGVRAEDDYCKVYLLDARFNWFLSANKTRIPEFVMEQITRVLPP